MAEPALAPPGPGKAESPAVPEVAEVESLLRRVARHERATEPIPSLARTGEAPRRGSGEAGPRPADAQNGPENQPFTGGSPHSD
jgi:hypothetical protein